MVDVLLGSMVIFEVWFVCLFGLLFIVVMLVCIVLGKVCDV